MSHLTTIETIFNDIDALRTAAERLGLTLVSGGTVRYHAGESHVCDLTVKLPGRYDLGFKESATGAYATVCDTELLSGSYGAQDAGRKLLGDNLGRFRQEYAIARVEQQARREGYTVSRRAADVSVGEVEGAAYVTLRRV